MTSIHNKLAHAKEYFIDKLESGMYEVADADKNTAKITIDNEFHFCIWIGSGWDFCRHYASMSFEYPILLPEFSDALKMDLHANLNEIRESRKKQAVQKKIDDLKKELEYLERQSL